MDDLELAALTFIARHRIPAYRPQPKPVEHKPQGAAPKNLSISSTQVNISTAHFTDDELDTLDRLLKRAGVPDANFTDEELETFERLLRKAGLPEHMLNPAPVEVEPQGRD